MVFFVQASCLSEGGREVIFQTTVGNFWEVSGIFLVSQEIQFHLRMSNVSWESFRRKKLTQKFALRRYRKISVQFGHLVEMIYMIYISLGRLGPKKGDCCFKNGEIRLFSHFFFDGHFR